MKCKNDSSKTYKGDEPSPKGYGYCASAEKIGSTRLGLNQHSWIVKQISNGSKRWVPVQPKTKTKKSNKTLNIRLVIGYHYDPDETKSMTQKEIQTLMKRKIVWDIANGQIDGVGIAQYVKGKNEYDVYPHFSSKNVHRVSVLSPPSHDPDFWEKLTKKHSSSIFNPDFVVVIDLKNVELRHNIWNTKSTIPINDEYLYSLKTTLNHGFYASTGWIADLKYGHRMEIVQIGYQKDNLKPDYRKFDIGWW